MTFLDSKSLRAMPFRSLGEDVLIDASAVFFGVEFISIGAASRIDAYCVISAEGGFVDLGEYVHLGVGCKLFGKAGIKMGSHSGLSAGVAVYSETDSYTNGSFTNPTHATALRSLHSQEVIFEDHAVVGANSVVLPGAHLRFGSSVGALSLVRGDVPEGAVFAGAPAERVGERDIKRLRQLQASFETLS